MRGAPTGGGHRWQQHTAQHLLTAIAAERFGWRTTSFHLGANRCDIELDVESLDAPRLHNLEQHERRGARLRELLSTGNDDLVTVTAGKLDRLQQAERRIKALEGQVAEQAAYQIASGDGPAAEARFQDADPSFLQQVGRQFIRTAGDGVALLTASGSKGAFFLLVGGLDSELDLRRIGPPIADLLQGRGGGSNLMFQGKAGSLAGRAQAVVLLAESLGR